MTCHSFSCLEDYMYVDDTCIYVLFWCRYWEFPWWQSEREFLWVRLLSGDLSSVTNLGQNVTSSVKREDSDVPRWKDCMQHDKLCFNYVRNVPHHNSIKSFNKDSMGFKVSIVFSTWFKHYTHSYDDIYSHDVFSIYFKKFSKSISDYKETEKTD